MKSGRDNYPLIISQHYKVANLNVFAELDTINKLQQGFPQVTIITIRGCHYDEKKHKEAIKSKNGPNLGQNIPANDNTGLCFDLYHCSHLSLQ